MIEGEPQPAGAEPALCMDEGMLLPRPGLPPKRRRLDGPATFWLQTMPVRQCCDTAGTSLSLPSKPPITTLPMWLQTPARHPVQVPDVLMGKDLTPKPPNLTNLSRTMPESPCCAHSQEREEPCHGHEWAQLSVQRQVSVQGQVSVHTSGCHWQQAGGQSPGQVPPCAGCGGEGAGTDAGVVPSDKPWEQSAAAQPGLL